MNHVLGRLCLAALLTAAIGAAAAQTHATSSPGKLEVLPTETIGSTEPTPEAPAAARKEAYAALAEAQHACRREENGDARRDCMAAAQSDFHNLLAQARAPS